MKWIIIIFIIGTGIAIYTGNLGGAKEAASNYHNVFSTSK